MTREKSVQYMCCYYRSFLLMVQASSYETVYGSRIAAIIGVNDKFHVVWRLLGDRVDISLSVSHIQIQGRNTNNISPWDIIFLSILQATYTHENPKGWKGQEEKQNKSQLSSCLPFSSKEKSSWAYRNFSGPQAMNTSSSPKKSWRQVTYGESRNTGLVLYILITLPSYIDKGHNFISKPSSLTLRCFSLFSENLNHIQS